MLNALIDIIAAALLRWAARRTRRRAELREQRPAAPTLRRRETLRPPPPEGESVPDERAGLYAARAGDFPGLTDSDVFRRAEPVAPEQRREDTPTPVTLPDPGSARHREARRRRLGR